MTASNFHELQLQLAKFERWNMQLYERPYGHIGNIMELVTSRVLTSRGHNTQREMRNMPGPMQTVWWQNVHKQVDVPFCNSNSQDMLQNALQNRHQKMTHCLLRDLNREGIHCNVSLY